MESLLDRWGTRQSSPLFHIIGRYFQGFHGYADLEVIPQLAPCACAIGVVSIFQPV